MQFFFIAFQKQILTTRKTIVNDFFKNWYGLHIYLRKLKKLKLSKNCQKKKKYQKILKKKVQKS